MDFDTSHTTSFRGRNNSEAMADNGKDCVRIKQKNLRIGYSMNLRLLSTVVRVVSLLWTMAETDGIDVAYKILAIYSRRRIIFPFFICEGKFA